MSSSQDESPLRDITSDEEERVRTMSDAQMIFISSAVVEDTGRYSCMAVSVGGKAGKSFDVNVYGKQQTFGERITSHVAFYLVHRTIQNQRSIVICPK